MKHTLQVKNGIIWNWQKETTKKKRKGETKADSCAILLNKTESKGGEGMTDFGRFYKATILDILEYFSKSEE